MQDKGTKEKMMMMRSEIEGGTVTLPQIFKRGNARG
jgi:hypothetical protein